MAVGEWDHRQLCPDGSCIGVIGPDGTCKVCGHVAPNWGDERRRGLVASADAATDDEDYDDDEEYEDDDGEETDDVVDPISPSAPASLGALAEWSERKLCPDGACIGLLGDDGTCKVCGKVGSAAKPRVSAASASTTTTTDDAALEAAAAELAAVVSPEAVEAVAPAPVVEADDEAERKLCPDGACVGVIGSDGRCKVCGKEAA